MKRYTRKEAVNAFFGGAIFALGVTLLLTNYYTAYPKDTSDDAMQIIANRIYNSSTNDLGRALIAMSVANSASTHCQNTSLVLETLLDKMKIQNKHLVLINDTPFNSHAVTLAHINGEWLVMDSLFNKVYPPEEIQYQRGLMSLRCIDGRCSNYNSHERLAALLFDVREYTWK